MKNFRKEKGITLVALIITIVILLILAAVAIAAIQNENILSHANNAAIKYNSSVDREQGILGGYLDVLDKYTGNDWITIYEGNATTQGGMALLGTEDLFAYGEALGITYRITVESDEFIGTVETVPILLKSENGMKTYLLFAVKNGQAIGITSKEDAYNKMASLGENYTGVGGVSQDGMCAIGLENAVCEYTITKIERKEVKNATLIYEGVATQMEDALNVGAILPTETDLTKSYLLEHNGVIYDETLISCYDGIMYLVIMKDGVAACSLLGSDLFMDTSIGIEGASIRLWEVGDNPNVVKEGEYIVTTYDYYDWVLYAESLSTGIPETVGGKTIAGIAIMNTGMVYYNRQVKIINSLDIKSLNIKVASSIDLMEFFETAEIYQLNTDMADTIIDLTEFEEATIPEEILSYDITIYVTEEVKANYKDYDNVVVKQ